MRRRKPIAGTFDEHGITYSFLMTENGLVVLPTDEMLDVLSLAGETSSVIWWNYDSTGRVQPYLMPSHAASVH